MASVSGQLDGHCEIAFQLQAFQLQWKAAQQLTHEMNLGKQRAGLSLATTRDGQDDGHPCAGLGMAGSEGCRGLASLLKADDHHGLFVWEGFCHGRRALPKMGAFVRH